MPGKIEFARNYRDNSTDQGFQFEFYCDRCGTGYRSRFQPSVTGTLNGVMDAASSVLGGIFSTASSLTSRVHNAAWEKAHDDAFMNASREILPEFAQCPRCQSWVCREKCWNTKRGLCKNCAPDMGVEMSAAQADRSVQEVWAHAAMSEEDKKLAESNWRETIHASCPKCEAPMPTNARFCPECGAEVKVEKHCTQCGALLQPNAKFCGDCGAKA